MRDAWGRKMTEIAKPGAYLITLAYPLGLSPDEGGPPFWVIPEHYDGPLKAWTKVLDREPEIGEDGLGARQRLMVWKKN